MCPLRSSSAGRQFLSPLEMPGPRSRLQAVCASLLDQPMNQPLRLSSAPPRLTSSYRPDGPTSRGTALLHPGGERGVEDSWLLESLSTEYPHRVEPISPVLPPAMVSTLACPVLLAPPHRPFLLRSCAGFCLDTPLPIGTHSHSADEDVIVLGKREARVRGNGLVYNILATSHETQSSTVRAAKSKNTPKPRQAMPHITRPTFPSLTDYHQTPSRALSRHSGLSR
jgi:hypothetical protein